MISTGIPTPVSTGAFRPDRVRRAASRPFGWRDESKLDDFFGLVELHFEPVKEPSLAEDGNDTCRVTESCVERKASTADFNRHLGKMCSDVSSTNAAVAHDALGIKGELEV